MRKELSHYFKSSKINIPILISVLFLFLFVLVNGFFIYSYNPDNNYFYTIKKIIPYPAFMVGNKIITFGSYEDALKSNRRIYETAYRIDFSKSQEGARNREALEEKTKKEIIDNVITKTTLAEMGVSVTQSDINKEYEKVIKDLVLAEGGGSTSSLIKYSPNIRDSDIKRQVGYSIARDRLKKEVVYNVRLKLIVIYPDNASREEDWQAARLKAEDLLSVFIENPDGFDEYFSSNNNNKDDILVKNFNREYYFAEDLPISFADTFYNIGENKISQEILKTEIAYYLLKSYDSHGYYRGSLGDYLDEQRSKIRIIDLVD